MRRGEFIGDLMTQSQIINVKTSGEKSLILSPGIKYQMLIDSFGTIVFINLSTGNYLPESLEEC